MLASTKSWLLSLRRRANRHSRRAGVPHLKLPNFFAMESLEDRSVPAVSYLAAGNVYSQNFDGLPNAGTFALTGSGPFALDAAPINATNMGAGDWYIAKSGGSGTDELFNVGDGSSATGSAYSYGATGGTDRALGQLASGTIISRMGVEIINNTGATITNFTVSFAAENWRRGNDNASTMNAMPFEYSIGGTNISTGTFAAFTPLNAVAVNPYSPDSKVDGNAASGRALRSATVTGLTWNNGQKLVLRWNDLNDANNDDGVGVDDFSFRAGANVVPVSTTIAAALTAAGSDGIVTVPAGTYAEAVTLTGTQQLIVSGAVTINSLSGPATSALLINSGAVLTVGDATDTTFAGVVSGGGAIVKQGGGRLSIPMDYQLNTLTNAPTNAISITGGTLETGRINIRSGGIVDVANGTSWVANGTINLMTNSTSVYTAVTGTGTLKLSSVSGSATNPDLAFGPNHRTNNNYGVAVNPTVDTGTFSRIITGRSGNNGFARYVGTTNGIDVEFIGPVIGTGGLSLLGQQINNQGDPVPFAISSPSTFAGPMNITWGSFYQNADGILNGNNLNFNPVTGTNARFFLWGHNASVSNLSSSDAGTAGIANGVRTSGASGNVVIAATLTTNQTADTTFAGLITDFIAERDKTGTNTSDPLSLTVTGSKSLSLSGANTYTGTTTVSGILAATNTTGSATGTGAITVNAGGTLTGSGIVTPTSVTLDGTLAGTLTAIVPITGSATASLAPATAGTTGFLKTGDVSLAAGAKVAVDFNGTTAGTGYDQIQVTGSANITDAVLSVTTGFAAAADDKFTIITTTSGVFGTFVGYPDGSTFTAGGQNFTINYTATEVILTRQPPPVRYVDDAWASFTNGQAITDADPVAPGDQNAVFGSTAFAKINPAITSVPALGTVIVNAGTYAEAVLVNKQITLKFQEGPITISSLDDSVSNAAINLDTITLTTGDAASTQLDSPIIGTGNLVKVGSGTFTMAANNSFTGTTQVSSGTLRAGSATAFASTSALAVDSGATLQLNGFSNSVILTNSGTVENASATPATLTIVGGTSTHSGIFRDGSGGGALGVTTNSSGVVTFQNGASSYTGATIISGGTLSVDKLASGGTNSGIGASTGIAGNLVVQNAAILEYTGVSVSIDRGMTIGTGGATVSVTTSGTTLTTSGLVSGSTNSFIKVGPGTLVFTTNDAMSTGSIFANEGTLRIGSITISKSRVLNIAVGAVIESSGTIRTLSDGAQNPNLVVDGAGVLSLVSTTSSAANPDFDFNINNADNSTANWGTQINAKVDLGSSQRFISGRTNHNGVSKYDLGADCVFAQEIAGTGGLTFISAHTYTGTGPMEVPFFLAAANTFSGPVEIIRGSVYLGTDTSLNGNVVTFNPAAGQNARLFLYNHSATLTNVTSPGAGNSVIANSAGRGTYSTNTLTLNNTANTTFTGTIQQFFLEYDGSLQSTPGVTSIVKAGSGTLTFSSNANTFAGSTTLTDGVLSVNAVANGSRTPNVTTTANSTSATVDDPTGLAVGQFIVSTTIPAGITITAVSGNTITLSTGAGVLAGTVQAVVYTPNSLGASTVDAANLVFNGGTLRYTGPASTLDRGFTVTELGGTIDSSGTGPLNFSNTGAVAYTGSGARTLTLTGSNTGENILAASVGDSGVDAVSIVKNGAGAWYLNGVNSNTGTTTASGGTLGGYGTLGNLAVTAATLTPGQGIGTLSTGNISFTAASTFTVELAGTVPGTTHDQVKTTGTVALGNAVLNAVPSFAAGVGDVFVIIDNDSTDAVTGTFSGLAEGKTIYTGGQLFKISYAGGTDNNDVVLTRVAPPNFYVDDDWAAFTNGQAIADADPVAAGAQLATFGTDAFASPNAALAANPSAGSNIVVNAGTYNQAVNVNKIVTLILQEGAISFSSLDDSLATATVSINGVTLSTGSDNSSTQVDSPITGTGGFVKQGSGVMTVTGANTYSGSTQVSGGVLKAGSASAFGTTSSMTVDSGATLRLNGFNASFASLAGGGTVENSAATSATLTIAGSGTVATLFQDGGTGSLGVTYNGGNFTPSNTANSYTGATSVTAGKLSLASIADIGTNSVIGAGSALVIGGGATLEYAGPTATSNRGFSLAIGGGTLAVTAAGNTLTLGGDIANATHTLTLDGSANATFNGKFTGSTGDLIKNGVGAATFTSDLAFGSVNDTSVYGTITTGNLTVNAGTLQADDIRLNISRTGTVRNISIAAGAFFKSVGTIALDPSFDVYFDQIAGPGTLQLRKVGATAADPSIAWDYGPDGGDASSYGSVISAPVDLGTTGTQVIVGKTSRNDAGRYAGDFRFDGAITGTAGMQFTGLNANNGHNMHFALRSANPAFTGTLGIANSDLILADNAALSSANAVTFNSINDGATTNRATLFLYGHDVTIGSLNDVSDLAVTNYIRNGSRLGMTGGGTNGNANPATFGVFLGVDDDSTLTVTQSVNGVFRGIFADGPNDNGTGTAGTYRTLSLVKNGNGTLSLTGASTHTGTNQVSSGTLRANNSTGSATGTGAVTVDNGATLGGSGTISGSVSASGTVAPGNTPGVLSTGNLTFTGTGSFNVELNGTSVGTGYDQAKVVGTVDLANATLTATAGFAVPGASKFTIIDNDDVDPVVGTFNGLAEGAAVTISGQGFTISYVGGTDNNDVVLTRDGSASPVVTGFVVNDGDTQRSRLTKVVVNFANPVDLAVLSVPGAVFFTRTGVPTNNVEPLGTVVDMNNGLLISPASGFGSSITLTFSNIDNTGIDFGSLSDGRWQLSIPSASYTSPNTPVDVQLRRLFGNFDNDTTVGGTDFGFYPPFGAAVNSPFDFDNNSDVSASDFSEFGNRFGFTLV